jgi:hypothetical protein
VIVSRIGQQATIGDGKKDHDSQECAISDRNLIHVQVFKKACHFAPKAGYRAAGVVGSGRDSLFHNLVNFGASKLTSPRAKLTMR